MTIESNLILEYRGHGRFGGGFEGDVSDYLYNLIENLKIVTRKYLIKATRIPATTIYDSMQKLINDGKVKRQVASIRMGKGRPKTIYLLKNTKENEIDIGIKIMHLETLKIENENPPTFKSEQSSKSKDNEHYSFVGFTEIFGGKRYLRPKFIHYTIRKGEEIIKIESEVKSLSIKDQQMLKDKEDEYDSNRLRNKKKKCN